MCATFVVLTFDRVTWYLCTCAAFVQSRKLHIISLCDERIDEFYYYYIFCFKKFILEKVVVALFCLFFLL
jgi:hypothetical protein